MSKNIFSKKKDYKKLKIIVIIIVIILIIGLVVFSSIKSLFKEENKDKLNTTNENEIAEVEQKPKPTDIIPGFNVTYEGDKHTIEASNVNLMMDGKYDDDKKYVFLTFDDGPTKLTSDILDILKEKDVKATFFILGMRLEDEGSDKLVKREIEEGHSIANHSYTHDLKKLYPKNKLDIEYFMEEFQKTNISLRNILGEEFDTKVLRLPGGYNSRVYYNDPNLTAFNERLKNDGDIVSIDWNALNGDAEGKPYTEEKMLQYVKDSSNGKNKVVILMHDSYGKNKTVKILPQVIDYFKEQGYEFKTIK